MSWRPKLYFCDTQYEEPITDLNPLLAQAYPFGNILAICAREQQAIRINKRVEAGDFGRCTVVARGWWELHNLGVFTTMGISLPTLCEYDAVVIVGEDRIDTMFHPMLRMVKACLQ